MATRTQTSTFSPSVLPSHALIKVSAEIPNVILSFAELYSNSMVVGPLQRVRPRNGILGLVVVLVVLVRLRSEFIGEL